MDLCRTKRLWTSLGKLLSAESVTITVVVEARIPSSFSLWECQVVTDKDKIKALSQCSPYSGCAAGAPAVLVPCYRTKGLMFPEFDKIDLAIATENALLEITSLGLGGVWLAVAPIEDRIEKVTDVLGTPETLVPFALVPFGYPAEDRPQQDRYDETRVHYVD